MQRQPLLIVGASARAAAWSAWRTGWLAPRSLDLFADRDLVLNCPAHAIPAADYPQGFLEAAAAFPSCPWMYTGGLENRPGLVGRLSSQRTLWGNPPEVLRRIRSPLLVAEMLRRDHILVPDVRLDPPPGDDPRPWLMKPLRSAGGLGIHWWNPQSTIRNPQSKVYFQEWIEGEPCSAAFVARDDGSVLELGVTRQLIGADWLHAGPFQYCGTIGPLSLPESVHHALQRLGETLTRGFSLRGLFGVDFILQGETPWPVEINPRYTASVEVLQRGADFALMSWHAAAFAPTPPMNERRPLARRIAGKAVLFAPRPGRFPDRGPWDGDLRYSWDEKPYPDFADVPARGTILKQGQPVLSVFALGTDEKNCLEALHARMQDLDRELFG